MKQELNQSRGSGEARVLVVGAGISGIRAALDLAEMGHAVCLLDRAPSIGGILTQLDHQFPNNHCGMCRMLPMVERGEAGQFCLRKGLFHENITIVTAAKVESVTGPPGRLDVGVRRRPAGIDQTKCAGCGDCEQVCPVTVPDRFNGCLSRRKAVYLPTPHQIPNGRVIDWDACTKCKACESVCPTGAIDVTAKAETFSLEAAAVILATGSELFDPSSVDLYGMGSLPNVVTATTFERILSSSGPNRGRLVRPSDGKEAKRLAWIQCVGSRNLMLGADYCSRACCMFAIKEAVLARQKIGEDAATKIFYMDMRTFGRDFQEFRDEAEHKWGVAFVRCRVHSIEPAIGSGDLRLSYVNTTGEAVDEVFDMVVLSTGQRPGQQPPAYAHQEGVHAVDASLGLRDISEAVIRASVAAERAASMLHGLGTAPLHKDATSHKEGWRRFENERPRFQVILCTCGDSLLDEISWTKIEQELRALPGGTDVSRIGSICTVSGWRELKEKIREGAANRLVVGACNPYAFLPPIRALEEETGLPAPFVEVVDLHRGLRRHGGSSDSANAIQRELEMTLGRLRARRLVETVSRPVRKSALIVGGGPSGVKAATILAGHDVEVVLVEKTGQLGGNLPNIGPISLRQEIEELVSHIRQHPLVALHYETQVVESLGVAGQFRTRIRHRSGEEQTLMHGVTILATGGRAASSQSYGFGLHDRIVTLLDLEKRLADPAFPPTPLQAVVMIQCADSRELPRNYCSRICCLKSLETALEIRRRHPQANVYVFYRDMMTYGHSEAVYTEARKNGVFFIPFDLPNRPQVRLDSGRVIVEGRHPILGADLRLEPDWVSLAAGVEPNPNEDLAKIFGIQRTSHGFFKEADSKWRPVDSGREGVFVCGLCRAPCRADEALREGAAAAQRALRILGKTVLHAPNVVARVRDALCSRCETCIQVCPYQARYADAESGRIVVDPVACQACGACAVACPNGAAVVSSYEEKGVLEAIERGL